MARSVRRRYIGGKETVARSPFFFKYRTMENNGNIRLYTFDDDDTSTGFIDTGQGQDTQHINNFENECRKFIDFKNSLRNYVSNLIREYVRLNDNEPIFLPVAHSVQTIEGDPGYQWDIYGFGLDETGEPSLFVILNGCGNYWDYIEHTPHSLKTDEVYSLKISGVKNLNQLIALFVENADHFEEIGLPNIQLPENIKYNIRYS